MNSHCGNLSCVVYIVCCVNFVLCNTFVVIVVLLLLYTETGREELKLVKKKD